MAQPSGIKLINPFSSPSNSFFYARNRSISAAASAIRLPQPFIPWLEISVAASRNVFVSILLLLLIVLVAGFGTS